MDARCPVDNAAVSVEANINASYVLNNSDVKMPEPQPEDFAGRLICPLDRRDYSFGVLRSR
jgi:hypothetical protein